MFTKMSTYIHLLTFVAILAFQVKSFCEVDKKPKVSVANSTHLKVTWEDAFKDCDEINVVTTNVNVDTKIFAQLFSAKEANVRADPCLKHEISVTIDIKRRNADAVPSQTRFYNYDMKIKSIYSGLLQLKFRGEFCATASEGPSIPKIPEIQEGIKRCVFADEVSWVGSHTYAIPIINPGGGSGRSKVIVDCKETNDNTFIIIVCGSCTLALFVIVVAFAVCQQYVHRKKETEIKADMNPVYDGAADYEYDVVGNHNNIEVSPLRKKEVKAEVVDRTSIYGKEEEEGWENAVLVDNNPDHGE